MNQDRKTFLKNIGNLAAGGTALSILPISNTLFAAESKDLFFDISLAQWSLHRALFDGKITNLEFITTTKNEFGIYAVEYVNQFFKDKAKDMAYLKEMKKISNNEGVDNVLIMIDGEGALGDADPKKRTQAVENHHKWVEAAKFLGCHSIRVNARSSGDYKEQMKLAADGLSRLTDFAAPLDMNVIVENHGGLSSNGKWLSDVIEMVDHPRCGTLPDFGNFNISEDKSYNRYKGVRQLMPYAKGVSAKSHVFDSQGYEKNTDYKKMLKIVKKAGYTGHIGIEYEGDELSEYEGVKATKKLLQMVGSTV